MITLVSIFANAISYLDRYFDQARALQAAAAQLGESVRVIAVEGDSRDDTRDRLRRFICQWPGSELVIRDHGGRVYHSVDIPERMQQLAYVWNGGFERVTSRDTFVAYVDSDLIWIPEVVLDLIYALRIYSDVDVVAPMVFAGPNFYDIWGFRKDGVNFSPFPPYHESLGSDLTEVDSAGAFLVMKGAVARTCRCHSADSIVGFCRDARSRGYRLWVNPSLKVFHP